MTSFTNGPDFGFSEQLAVKMDGLEEFEKALAVEKVAREPSNNHGRDRERHHRHHHRSRNRRSRDENGERGHRHKRSRNSREAEVSSSEGKPQLPDRAATGMERDSWMVSAPEVEYKQRLTSVENPVKSRKPDYGLKIHKNELNYHLRDLVEGESLEDLPGKTEIGYTFGDEGSQWRLTKLKAVYREAKLSGRLLEEVAIERFGDLRDFDDVREEEIEVGRRELYGKDYIGKDKPNGELYMARNSDAAVREDHLARPKEHLSEDGSPFSQGEVVEEKPSIDATTLNRLKAQMMKAKLKGTPEAAKLEEEYSKAALLFSRAGPTVVTLGVMQNRMLAGPRGEVKPIENKRGRERGLVEESEDMSIEDMVREERQTRGQAGGEGERFANRIVKDGKFDASLDYMDENAEKLAKRVYKSEINLKNAAISEYRKTERILDSCPLCHHEDKNQSPAAPIISLATRVYLTLPTEPELSEGGAVIVPIQHHINLLECDDDEWEEIRNFMKCLTRMYHEQGRDVVFYENAAAPQRKLHAAMQAVPLPYSLGETAPAFFKEAILASDEEWTQHKKLIDTALRARSGLGKNAFRRSIAKEMPYFHVWFEMDGGLGHIVEDSKRWPKGDLFVREIIGGMLDLEPDVIKRQGRWIRGADRRSEGFKKRWKKFDWTRVLTESQ